MRARSTAALAALLALPALSAPGRAQGVPLQVLELGVGSGVQSGTGFASGPGEGPRLAFEHSVYFPGVPWMWIELDGTTLGPGSYVALLSAEDGGYQVLDAASIAEWSWRTAVFNGDLVHVQLWVAPEDPGSRLVLDRTLAGQAGYFEKSLCGSDDRVASTDNRVGRLTPAFCTGWRVTNGAMLTAGHCGTLSGNVMEFNVPASDPDGTTNASDPNDQYPVTPGSVLRENGGIGDDWCRYTVGPNSNTGLLPHQAYGLPFRVSVQTPSLFEVMRVTGFGGDTTPFGTTFGGNSANFTNQTAIGPYIGLDISSSSTASVEYQVDTEGGNSGSPVIRNSLGYAIGVHTNAGCSSSAGNTGTSFLASDLAAAVDDFPGASSRYVDAGHPQTSFEAGTVFQPFDTFLEGVNSTPVGKVLSIVTGSYPSGSIVITKAMSIQAPCGTVVIGD